MIKHSLRKELIPKLGRLCPTWTLHSTGSILSCAQSLNQQPRRFELPYTDDELALLPDQVATIIRLTCEGMSARTVAAKLPTPINVQEVQRIARHYVGPVK